MTVCDHKFIKINNFWNQETAWYCIKCKYVSFGPRACPQYENRNTENKIIDIESTL